MNFHLISVSSNKKTGPIAVTYSSQDTCPDSCPLKNGGGCYAEYGNVNIHWNRTTNGTYGSNWDVFCNSIKNMNSIVFRHNVAGDLPSVNGKIHHEMMKQLVKSSEGKKGFTYTHHDVSISENREIIKECNDNGFTINLSANNMSQVDEYINLGIGPVVTVLPENTEKTIITKSGNKIVVCPATYKDNVTCKSCMLCAKSNRKVVIGFPAHGTKKKSAEMVFNLGK
jgi:hypothetical protein